MARDESAQEKLDKVAPPEETQVTAATADAQPPVKEAATVAPAETTDEPVLDERPDVKVQLDPDSGLEAPVALSVAGLFKDRDPLPAPSSIRDDEGNFLEGFNENTVTLVETENGFEHPDGPAEPVVKVDEHGRLVLTDSTVTLPAAVADVVASLPFVKVVG